MNGLSSEQKEAILKMQSVLVAISNKQDVFFNTTQYVNMGLIREFGKTLDNKTNWVLTQKGKQIMSVVLN